jgi:type II secretory pathway pseudopilin PulG
MTARGFSLVELLIAAALATAVAGALAAMVAPLATFIDRAHANADMDAGMRSALQHLTADLRQAGSDAAIALPGARLARVLAPVTLLRDLESGEAAVPGTAIRLTFVPRLAAQGALAVGAAAGDTLLRLDTASRCATGPPSCGFRPGQSAVLYSSAGAAAVSIDRPAEGVVVLTRPLGVAFPAGAVLCEIITVSYGTRHVADGSRRLVRLTTGGAEQPMLDHVVEFSAATDTGDPVLASSLSWILRVQAPAAAFRGPAGFLFRRAGTATRARQWVPDVEVRGAVALRNAEASRW